MAAASVHKIFVLACGALAKEIVALLKQCDVAVDLQCLPAEYHNHPEKIVPGLKQVLDAKAADYDRILIGYGDCGTGGGLDRLLEAYPNTIRLPGNHCYAFYAGLSRFEGFMEEELGTFFLTDYLARHFQTLIVKGMGIDRYPGLKETYFVHYKKLIYLSQNPTDSLLNKAREAALFLGLEFEHKPVGYGALETAMSWLALEDGALKKAQLEGSHV